MSFGKNRVQYSDFVWQFYRFKKFDTYFYAGGNELAQYISKSAISKIDEFEKYFDYALDKRIIFVVYNTLSDLRQSNIGLSTEDDAYNIGGTTKIIDNKVFIYFDGDHKKLDQQIAAAIAEVIINEYLVGNDLKARVANTTLIALPEWYVNGLISYLSRNWDFEIENRVKDGILSGKYEKFNRLTGDDATYAGHSIWYYIASKYGKKVIPNILYLTRVSKNIDSGFMYVVGSSLKYLSMDWLHFFDDIYYTQNGYRNLPEDENNILKKSNKVEQFDQSKISPDGKLIAYTTNEMGKYKIFLYDVEKQKHRKIFKKEHKLDQITDYSYPVLGWHPSGKILAWFYEDKGTLFLCLYDIEEKKAEKREIIYFNKVLTFDYSEDGFKMVLSATKRGQSDIYIYNVPSNSVQNVTQDFADDTEPRFINNSKEIIFSSNRIDDTLSIEKQTGFNINPAYDIFIYNLNSTDNKLKRLTSTTYTNETSPYITGKNLFCFLSDDNGIVNRHIASFDSSIAYIDTTTHFIYYTVSHPLTNYSRNILFHDLNLNDNKSAELIFSNDKYHLFYNPLNLNTESLSGNYSNTFFKNNFDKLNKQKDTIVNTVNTFKYIHVVDSSENRNDEIDINNYIFETEKKAPKSSVEKSDTTFSRDTTINPDFDYPKIRYYFKAFYTNYLVNQIDFNFLNQTYQAYTGGAVYFNPNFSLLFKLGTNDLMEDYRITGGFRISGNFDSNEYLLCFENLKKRWDKQFVFHRLAFLNPTTNGDYLVKNHTHELHYIMKYPFNQVSRFDFTTSYRYDRQVYKARSSIHDLQKENEYMNWAGVKGEYVFDNTLDLGVNLYDGTRYKLFGEAYKQIDAIKSDLFVVGFDFRHYEKIHRNLILASRFAGSTSFGNSLLIYYLGSVDNWINLSAKVEKFDQTIKPNPEKHWVYQTLATNMRGFTQNVRNGNTFLIMNNELRWPIIRYFTNKPINSDFLNTFQLIGFFDIGTAWTGSSPLSDENSYNNDVYNEPYGPVIVIIDNEKDPYVYGFGFGLRSRLLGYFIRVDWAWGVDSGVLLPRIFYVSLSLDF
ncbi:MAG: hypothetical protein ABIJ97_06635 [Bacteroidota bacterium]